jgi:hypothetical protein
MISGADRIEKVAGLQLGQARAYVQQSTLIGCPKARAQGLTLIGSITEDLYRG